LAQADASTTIGIPCNGHERAAADTGDTGQAGPIDRALRLAPLRAVLDQPHLFWVNVGGPALVLAAQEGGE
jgi:hypothetical protein